MANLRTALAAFTVLTLVASPVVLLSLHSAHAQDRAAGGPIATAPRPDFAWPAGIRGAVSLSYDDAVPIHYQHVGPVLVEHGLRGTFYLTINSVRDPQPWKDVGAAGHELGNHTLFHPCRRVPPENFGWLAEHYDLAEYTPDRFRSELRITNLVLDLMDGGRRRTYGNTCTHLTIGRGEAEQPMDGILADLFIASRGNVTNRPVNPKEPIAFSRLGHYSGDGRTFEQLRGEIEAAVEGGGWIIYMFHGVGEGTHNLFIDTEEHRKLVAWLGERRSTIWTAPVADVAGFIRNGR